MREADFDPFAQLLADVWSLKGQALNGGAKALWFRALSAYPLGAVQAALDAYLRDPNTRGFLPMPGDIVGRLDRMDGRPGAEEAWAIAARALDEGETVVWTAEISEAWATARPIFPDEVGARMAFRETYERLVDDARHAHRPAAWQATIGHDPERRDRMLVEAVRLGRLHAPEGLALPAPRGAVALLEGASQEGVPDFARAALLALREWLTAAPHEVESADAAARRRTEHARAEAQRRVDSYTGLLQ